MADKSKTMTVLDHLNELRSRILISLLAFVAGFVAVLVFYTRIIRAFTVHFDSIQTELGLNLFANTVAEGFLVQLQASAILGIILSSPIHVMNILQFVFPGITRKARKIASAGLVASFLLAVFGAFLSYTRIIPFSIRFLTDSSFIPSGVGMLLNYRLSVTYVLSFLFWAIITFQSPLVLELLLALNLLNRKAVFKATRFVIVGIFILSAVVTPSVDPVSHCAIALPLIILYFVVILVAKIFKLGEG